MCGSNDTTGSTYGSVTRVHFWRGEQMQTRSFSSNDAAGRRKAESCHWPYGDTSMHTGRNAVTIHPLESHGMVWVPAPKESGRSWEEANAWIGNTPTSCDHRPRPQGRAGEPVRSGVARVVNSRKHSCKRQFSFGHASTLVRDTIA